MKTILLFLFLSLITVSVCIAQAEKSPTVKFLKKRGYTFPGEGYRILISDSVTKWPDTLYYNTAYRARLYGSPTIPISFSRIAYVNGSYQLSPTISIGYGYTWFFGNFIFNENDKIDVDPTFFFGLIADVGVQNNFDITNPASFFTGGFFGFKAYTLFFGYDFIARSASIGIGGRIDIYTIRQKSLNPIGKVRELRKHKSVAVPIANE